MLEKHGKKIAVHSSEFLLSVKLETYKKNAITRRKQQHRSCDAGTCIKVLDQ